MKEKRLSFVTLLSALILLFAPISTAAAADNIVIGAPLSTAFLYGWDAEGGIKLAVEEINAQGGVTVGGKKMPFKVEVIDTRDLEPGVPVSDALMAVEPVAPRNPLDLEEKFVRASTFTGPKLFLTLSACPTGWLYDPGETPEVAKLAVETGLWPLKEAINGEVTHTYIPKRKPVEEYLKLQGRFRHLFEPAEAGRSDPAFSSAGR